MSIIWLVSKSLSDNISLRSWGFYRGKFDDFRAGSTSRNSQQYQIFSVLNIFKCICSKLFVGGTIKNEYFKLINCSGDTGSWEAILLAIWNFGFRDYMFQTFHQRWLKSVNRVEKKITSVFVQVWLFQMALKTPSCHSIPFLCLLRPLYSMRFNMITLKSVEFFSRIY